jgi:DNA adenine methylase
MIEPTRTRREHAARPFVRWAGSKRAIISRLIPLFRDPNRRYIEPFMGSASLFFAVRPPRAVLSDLNQELVQTFRQVRRHPRRVAHALELLPNTREDYYKVRNLDVAILSSPERAARFIYLNRFCFNGLYRTNLSGQFNVPYGRPKNDNRPNASELLQCSAQLRKATIVAGDFEDIVRTNVRRHDIVYLDPPFAVGSRRVFKEYNGRAFATDDLIRLSSLLYYIDQCGAKFVLSYAACAEATKLFNSWHVAKILVQRNIAGFAHHRRKSFELIISNQQIQLNSK